MRNRRECLDHVVFFGETYLRRILQSYATTPAFRFGTHSPSPREGRKLPLAKADGLADQLLPV
jgi:hypothetical protein